MIKRALKTLAYILAALPSLTGLLMVPALRALRDRRPTGARGVVSLDGAYSLCRRSTLQGWELVDFATGLVHDKFRIYSCRNLWDTPGLAFKYGMGYCVQYNLALAQLLGRLGFNVKPVFATRIESPRRPGWRMGHVWLRVTIDGETRDVCAGSAENRAGAVDFRPRSPVRPAHPAMLLLAHFGFIWYAGLLEWRSALAGRPLPSWMFEQR